MRLSVLPVLVSLLCAVVLCGAQGDSSPAPEPSSSAPTNSTGMVTNTTTTFPITSANVTGTTDSGNSTDSSNSTDPQPTEGATPLPGGGLSDGAIAGIVIGSIAGVGVLGGGVYGLLKYTGKI